MIGNEIVERVEENLYLEQTGNVNPALDREIKRRMGVEWTAFRKQGDIVLTQNGV